MSAKKYKAVLRPEGESYMDDSDTAYYVLPATPEAYDAQLFAVAKALWRHSGEGEVFAGLMKQAFLVEAEHALAAIGIKRPCH